MTKKTVEKPQYWLLKSEPDCYSIDDLKRDKVEMWDGTRNYQVRNLMRDEMKKGDLCLFYHSNAGNETGVVGTMKIAKEAYPDPTQFDPKATYKEPEQVAALKKIQQQYTSPETSFSLTSVGKSGAVKVVHVPKSDHIDPKSNPVDPRWLCVDVRFSSKLKRVVTLTELKNDPAFSDMTVVQKGNRLSVMPIKKKHFERILKLSEKD